MVEPFNPEIVPTIPNLFVALRSPERTGAAIAELARRTREAFTAPDAVGSPYSLVVRPSKQLEIPKIVATQFQHVEGAAYIDIDEREITHDRPFQAVGISQLTRQRDLAFSFKLMTNWKNYPLVEGRSKRWPTIWQVPLDTHILSDVELTQLSADGEIVDVWTGDSASAFAAEEQRAAS